MENSTQLIALTQATYTPQVKTLEVYLITRQGSGLSLDEE